MRESRKQKTKRQRYPKKKTTKKEIGPGSTRPRRFKTGGTMLMKCATRNLFRQKKYGGGAILGIPYLRFCFRRVLRSTQNATPTKKSCSVQPDRRPFKSPTLVVNLTTPERRNSSEKNKSERVILSPCLNPRKQVKGNKKTSPKCLPEVYRAA